MRERENIDYGSKINGRDIYTLCLIASYVAVRGAKTPMFIFVLAPLIDARKHVP